MDAFRDSPELMFLEKATTQVQMVPRCTESRDRNHTNIKDSVLEWQGFEAGNAGHSLVT